MSNIAGLIYGPDYHYLDHLAPLCALLEIPLICSEKKMSLLAGEFYPDLEMLHLSPEQTVHRFDTLITCMPRILYNQIFFLAESLLKKKVTTIWCPHGNSDKGRTSPFMEALQEEKLLLTYGRRIEEFLKEKGVSGQTIRIGNYRLLYFEKHRSFMQEKLNQLLGEKTKPRILYAPTWQDGENNSSFPEVLNYLPQDCELIIKLHPNLYHQYPEEIESLNLMEDFPPIYPLLSSIDLLIGDMSSIAYDALSFHKPMILLNQQNHQNWALTSVAKTIIPSQYKELPSLCKAALQEPINQASYQTLYEETFSKGATPCAKLLSALVPQRT